MTDAEFLLAVFFLLPIVLSLLATIDSFLNVKDDNESYKYLGSPVAFLFIGVAASIIPMANIIWIGFYFDGKTKHKEGGGEMSIDAAIKKRERVKKLEHELALQKEELCKLKSNAKEDIEWILSVTGQEEK